jgi:hypothetical protein
MGKNIITQIEATKVFDTVDKAYAKQYHHSKPHTNMEIEIPDCFIQDK